MRNPQQWLPPLSAIKKVACLVQSHAEYLMTICKPDADLPDFIGNGGLCRTKEGDIMYDFDDEAHYSDEQLLLTTSDSVLKERVLQARSRLARQSRKKRDLSESPYKEEKGAKRTLYTSTPR